MSGVRDRGKALRFSRRVYEGLLAAYPGRFRGLYGEEMADLFADGGRTAGQDSLRSGGGATTDVLLRTSSYVAPWVLAAYTAAFLALGAILSLRRDVA